MHLPSKPKVVLLGMMTKMPVAGVVWQNVHYLVGFERLGCEVYYVEEHARTPSMFMETEQCDSSAKAAAFIDQVMRRFDLGDRWCLHGLHEPEPRCFGMSHTQLKELYASADVIINLHGGTIPLPEHYATGRLVYLETDPVQLQIELYDNRQETIDFLEPHCAFFTFGENLGAPDCGLPVDPRFAFKPTRQPVVMDFWHPHNCGPAEVFTSIGNWEQQWREVRFKGETYTWSKHHEFLKFIDLPSRTPRRFELALASCPSEAKALLEGKGWAVRDAMDFSMDAGAYRDYIAGSRGEFTVAKDQNVRLRSGWFSDRSATYLAAGRPVITQDTGFGNILPTGLGLFGFSTTDEILRALEAIDADYAQHCRAAAELAREFFNYDVVLGGLLGELGLSRCKPKPEAGCTLSPALELAPISRRPIRLPDATLRSAAELGVPVAQPPQDRSCHQVSIVIVTWGGLVFTKLCLASLLENTKYPHYEVIIVDNGSTDGTVEYLRQVVERNSHVLVFFNTRNAGFAAANNRGLRAASGHVLVLLNNDTLVPTGWLRGLLERLQDPAAGLVGPVTNRIGNSAEIATDYRTYGEMIEFARRQMTEHHGEFFDIAMPAMFCLAMRRDAFAEIGALDEQFELGLFEDDDYAMRARQAGYRVVCAEDSFVHHFSEASFGALAPSGEYARLLEANRRRFEEKWGVRWEPAPRRERKEYRELVDAIREEVDRNVPPGAIVAVASKGDDALLDLGAGRAGWHFPQRPDGDYSGHHPADSAEAIAQLEALRARGADFLLFPKTTLWWLDHYRDLQMHLNERCRRLGEHDACVIFSLREPHSGSSG